MQLVTAIIKPFKLDDVRDALAEVGGLGRIKALFHETDKYRSSFLRQLFTISS